MHRLHGAALTLVLFATACGGGEATTHDDTTSPTDPNMGATGGSDASGGGNDAAGGTEPSGGAGGADPSGGTGGGSSGSGGDPGSGSGGSTSGGGGSGGSTGTGSGGSTTNVCGDGSIGTTEACDDGNTQPGDGCGATCALEAGYSCLGQPSQCATVCGDGLVVGAELCDDGNTNTGDGCDTACKPEPGYTCDGLPSVCTVVPTAAGDLIITEIMKNPGPSITDANGEWFEIYNATSVALDLFGLEIADQGSDSHVIGSHVVIAAGGYAVLGRNANPAANGGVSVDYQYSGIGLTNGDDEIELWAGNALIDSVAYTDAAFPDVEGVSLNLAGSVLDDGDNDLGSSWCGASSGYGTASQQGTPGNANTSCSTSATPPSGWTCSPSFYNANDGCDCGCGVTDPDCADTTSASCQYCNNSNGCSTVSGCGDINPVDNAICGAPSTWTCSASFYAANDGCDCGCGTVDPDCADATSASCQWCNNSNSCSAVTGCGDINPTDNASCGAPSTWTCSTSFYNAGDGCDCGCGAVDPDCADATASSCLWCDNANSCSGVSGCSDISPTDNASCGAPAGWTCNPSYYNAGDGCDCGCGAFDPDCSDPTILACNWCDDIGSCSILPGCFDIHPLNNTGCL